IRGWETAAAAQARIISEVDTVLAAHEGGGDILVVGHGAVGTLLMTHLLGLPVSRTLDQPGGGGNVFAFDLLTRAVIHRWRRFEEMA
ncbi:histidine phosphatase family protein, partial [Acinetobacter baumannii]